MLATPGSAAQTLAARSRKTDTVTTASGPTTWEHYVRAAAVPRDLIDDFLTGPSWGRFDAELGYVLQNSLVPWGIGGSRTIETVDERGARSSFVYRDRPRRIATYGNSFTESNQTSDGETWQEYLAGHLGEPVANYGVGGYGVFQAYRRMVRTETADPAEYVVLYVWGDDPHRSLMRSRWLSIYPWFVETARRLHLFHAGPWAHLEMDLETGAFAEIESAIDSPEGLYRMCDPDWMWENLGGDLAVQLHAFTTAGPAGSPPIAELDREPVSRLADHLDAEFDWHDEETRRTSATELLNRYSQVATNHILDRAREFLDARGSRLLVVLNYAATLNVPTRSADRNDQLILDHLANDGFDYFDMTAVHTEERTRLRLTEAEYEGLYRIDGTGHYSPRGNHFFAYAIAPRLVEMLDPRPLPYRDRSDDDPVDFSGYLPRR
jgi:hypothetical protein